MFDRETYLVLADRYYELTGGRADKRWSQTTLALKVAELETQQQELADRIAEKKKAGQTAKEMREALIAERGAFDEFEKTYRRSNNDNDYRLARAVGWARRVIEAHEKIAAKLAKRYAENPCDAMGWSMEYFQHAAEYRIALGLKQMFEAGDTVESMAGSVMREVLRKAKSPGRSTSPVSNLLEQEEHSAAAKLAGYLSGDEYF